MHAQTRQKAVALFSGGLDSILAVRLVQEQGIELTGLHFISPFFGKPESVTEWESRYGLPIRLVDIGERFVRMLVERPRHGFGSVLNPCIDCKILMLRRAKEIMAEMGACCIISGEVLGQRPMSQRRDSLNVISRDAGVKGCLLRPLSALRLEPTEAELAGCIDRERLLAVTGRGRKEQMALAERFGLKDIPAPAGGCLLTEQENARSYWPVLTRSPQPCAGDFRLAVTGRQYWHGLDDPCEESAWLIIGRNQADNDALMALADSEDLVFKTRDFPGPLALGRFFGRPWSPAAVQSAAAFMASYSPKCVRHVAAEGGTAAVRVHTGSLDGPGQIVTIVPDRQPPFAWREHGWPETREAVREEARKVQEERLS